MVDSFEKIPVNIFPDLKEGSAFAAKELARLVRDKQAKKEKCVLGLATGSTPKTLYAELVRMHKEEGLSFKNVIAFNLDEYYPIDKDAFQSYARFMKVNLFDQIDIGMFRQMARKLHMARTCLYQTRDRDANMFEIAQFRC